jgi:U4/U6 small nuclear ribonucleoprotein PRP3
MLPGRMSGILPGMPVGAPNVGALANYEAIKRAHELAMRLGFHQIPFGMPTMPTMMPTNLAEDGLATSVKAPVLRLDAQGREIDEHGKLVERSKVTNVSTLKVRFSCAVI